MLTQFKKEGIYMKKIKTSDTQKVQLRFLAETARFELAGANALTDFESAPL